MQKIRYCLCAEQGFARAAKRCGVSRPSLSNASRRLEEDLGGSLCRRIGRRAELPLLGAAARPYLQQIDRAAEKAKRETVTFPVVRATSAFKTKERVMREIA